MIARTPALLLLALVTVPFLHHGHIGMFISDVRRRFEGRSTVRRRLRQESSRLSMASGEPLMRYEVAVRRKTRAVETSLYFEGEREGVDRWVERLAQHADAIRAKLGPDVEPERLTRTSARLRQVRLISTVADWSPKRDLTPELVTEIAEQLSRFVEVLEPIVATRQRG